MQREVAKSLRRVGRKEASDVEFEDGRTEGEGYEAPGGTLAPKGSEEAETAEAAKKQEAAEAATEEDVPEDKGSKGHDEKKEPAKEQGEMQAQSE